MKNRTKSPSGNPKGIYRILPSRSHWLQAVNLISMFSVKKLSKRCGSIRRYHPNKYILAQLLHRGNYFYYLFNCYKLAQLHSRLVLNNIPVRIKKYLLDQEP